MKKDFAVYPAMLSKADDGITITFPDLPGCISCAKSDEEAVFMARDALGAWIVANEDMGNAIPKPCDVSSIKTRRDEAICLVEAWLPIFREEKRAGSVKKNVTIPIWMNSLAERANLNFSQVLQAGIMASLGITNR